MGVRFVNTGEGFKKYIVQVISEDAIDTVMKTASQIIGWVDMSDCYPELDIRVWESCEDGLIELDVRGCWHDMDNPLYIEAVRPDGSVAFDGYGTDH